MKKNIKVLLIYPNTMMATLIPIHFSILSACLKEKGFEVRLFDTTYYRTEEKSFEEKKVELLQVKRFSYKERGVRFKETDIYDDLRSMVNDYKPDIIGITFVEDTYKLGLSLLKCIEEYNIPVIAGGVFINFYAEEIIKESSVDMLCIGEGEKSLVELCSALLEGRDFTRISNLWIKKDDGIIIKNDIGRLVDLDSLPYLDFDIYEQNRMYRPMQGQLRKMLHFEVQRGCPYDCTYCDAPAIRGLYKENGYNNYYRSKSIDRMMEELRFLVRKYSPDYINFCAESFLSINTEELKRLAEFYIRDIGLPFWCQSRPETITKEKVDLLKKMNCTDMQFGIEHGNADFRARILNRRSTNEKIVEALKIVESHNIPYTVNNIIGFPDETRELIFDTINLNRELRPKTLNCYMFTPYRGTFLRDYCIEKGYLDKDAETMQALDGADYKYKTITKEELYGLQRTFSLYARFPKEEYDMIKIAEKLDKKGNAMFKRLSRLYYERFFC